MNNKNHVQLIGRLGTDPTAKELKNGKMLVRFSLAVNDTRYSADGTKVRNIQWHQIAAWGKMATVCQQLLHKGTAVTIDGKLQKKSFTDKAGNLRSTVVIVATQVMIMNRQLLAA